MSETEFPFGDPIEEVIPDLSVESVLLPGWLTERMMNEVWHFVLLLNNDCVVYIQTVNNVTQAADGSLWLEVTLNDRPSNEFNVPAKYRGNGIYAVVDRNRASVKVENIVAAYEVADT